MCCTNFYPVPIDVALSDARVPLTVIPAGVERSATQSRDPSGPADGSDEELESLLNQPRLALRFAQADI